MTKRQPNGPAEQVRDALRKRYVALDEGGAIEISPAHLAREVWELDIDREGGAGPMARFLGEMHLRQLAREVCRKANELAEESDQSGQCGLFGLQPRYPAHRDGGETYVLLAHLSEEEYDYNIDRLRREAIAKQEHADRLEAAKLRRFPR